MKKLIFQSILSIGLACGLTAQAQEAALPSSFAEALNAHEQPIQLVSHAHHQSCEPCGTTCQSRPSGFWYAGVEMPLLKLYANHGAGGSIGPFVGDRPWFLDSDSQAALRLFAGYQAANGLGIRGRFFTFEGDAGADDFFDVELYDLEATSALNLRNWTFLAFGGMRWGSIDFSDNSFAPGAHNFDGYGFTMGGEARRSIGSRLNLVAGVRHSVLYGEMERAGAFPTLLDNSIVPITEYRLGVEYGVTLGGGNRVIAGIGYEHQQYNSLSGLPTVDPEDVDVALAGPVFSLTLLY